MRRLFAGVLVASLLVPGCRAADEADAADRARGGDDVQRAPQPRPIRLAADVIANPGRPAPAPTTPAAQAAEGTAGAVAATTGGFQPTALQVLVDCNQATMDFGLGFRDKRYLVTPNQGLDQVLAAFSRAVSAQPELVVGAAPVRYCGYAETVQCPTDPPRTGDSRWADVCRPFDEGRGFGGMGAALDHIVRTRGTGNGFGALLTHGLVSRRAGTQAGMNLERLPFRELGVAIAKGETSFALIVMESVPYRRTTHNGVTLRKVGAQPVAPMALLVWGPDGALMADLLETLIANLQPFAPKAIRLASFDASHHAAVLSSVTVHTTALPPRGKKTPKVVSAACKRPNDRAASCSATLPGPKTAYQPQRDVLALSFVTEPAPPDRWGHPTWRPAAVPVDLHAKVTATYRSASGRVPVESREIAHVRVAGASELASAFAAGSVYLSRVSPVAPCPEALGALKNLVKPYANDDQLTADQRWPQTVLIPVRCLISGLSSGSGRGKPDALPARLELAIEVEMRPPTRAETRTTLVQLMDDAGIPQGDVAGDDGVAGMRQALIAIAAAAVEDVRDDHGREKLATIEVVIE